MSGGLSLISITGQLGAIYVQSMSDWQFKSDPKKLRADLFMQLFGDYL